MQKANLLSFADVVVIFTFIFIFIFAAGVNGRLAIELTIAIFVVLVVAQGVCCFIQLGVVPSFPFAVASRCNPKRSCHVSQRVIPDFPVAVDHPGDIPKPAAHIPVSHNSGVGERDAAGRVGVIDGETGLVVALCTERSHCCFCCFRLANGGQFRFFNEAAKPRANWELAFVAVGAGG